MVVSIIFLALYATVFFMLFYGFCARKIQLFGSFGWLFFVIAMRVTSMSLSVASEFSLETSLGVHIAQNILLVESYCFLSICLYNFLTDYRIKTAGVQSSRAFTWVAYFTLGLVAILFLVATITLSMVAYRVSRDRSLLAASGWINLVAMLLLMFFTVSWIAPFIKARYQESKRGAGSMNAVLILLLCAWLCMMIRVIFGIVVVISGIAGADPTTLENMGVAWVWLALVLDFIATVFMATTYYPGRRLTQHSSLPYQPYGSAEIYAGPVSNAFATSQETLDRKPTMRSTNSFTR